MYDAILGFQSLSDFVSSRSIDILQSPHSLLDLGDTHRVRIVAVVGLFDKGKTYLINKLFGLNLPSGKLFTTKGLSFFWAEERRMLIVDSAGVQATVSYRGSGQDVQPIVDAQTTESIIFEVISRMAHYLLFVVNDLTWFEQKYIAMLQQKYVQTQASKELIVVHNMRTTSVVEEATSLFSHQIMQSYEGAMSHLGDLVYTARRDERTPAIHHVGICMENSEAGSKFNAPNLKYIMDSLEYRNTYGADVKLGERLAHEIHRILPTFVVSESLDGAKRSSEQMRAVYVDDEAGQREGAYVRKALLRLEVPHNVKASMRTQGVVSPLGEIIAHDVNFEPKTNVYEHREGREVRRTIEVECPGVPDENIVVTELPNGVKVEIQKDKSIDENRVEAIEPLRQNHGRWFREFNFESSHGKFQVEARGVCLERGLLRITLRRQSVGRTWPVQPAAASGDETPLTQCTADLLASDPDAPSTPSGSQSASCAAGAVGLPVAPSRPESLASWVFSGDA